MNEPATPTVPRIIWTGTYQNNPYRLILGPDNTLTAERTVVKDAMGLPVWQSDSANSLTIFKAYIIKAERQSN